MEQKIEKLRLLYRNSKTLYIIGLIVYLLVSIIMVVFNWNYLLVLGVSFGFMIVVSIYNRIKGHQFENVIKEYFKSELYEFASGKSSKWIKMPFQYIYSKSYLSSERDIDDLITTYKKSRIYPVIFISVFSFSQAVYFMGYLIRLLIKINGYN